MGEEKEWVGLPGAGHWGLLLTARRGAGGEGSGLGGTIEAALFLLLSGPRRLLLVSCQRLQCAPPTGSGCLPAPQAVPRCLAHPGCGAAPACLLPAWHTATTCLQKLEKSTRQPEAPAPPGRRRGRPRSGHTERGSPGEQALGGSEPGQGG